MGKLLALMTLFAAVALGNSFILNGSLQNDIEILPMAPYRTSIGFSDEKTNMYSHRCGGGIISEYWVLTAASCLDKHINMVIAGIAALPDGSGRSFHRIKRTIPYPGYYSNNKNVFFNNIMLISVTEPFVYGITQRFIPLYDPNEKITPGSVAYISQWAERGDHDSKCYYWKIRDVIEVEIIEANKCHGPLIDRLNSIPGKICIKYDDEDFCSGDAGALLVVFSQRNKEYTLAGIASHPYSDGPGVFYTEVAFYRNWIRKIANV